MSEIPIIGQETLQKQVERLTRQYKLGVEALTEKQLVELLVQVLASGDIVKYIVRGPEHGQFGEAQRLVYLPFKRADELQDELHRLKGYVDKTWPMHDEWHDIYAEINNL